MLKAFKYHLRHNAAVAFILWLPRQIRLAVYGYLPALIGRKIRDVVRGGVLVVRPNNIGLDFEVDSLSDISLRVLTTGSYEPEFVEALDSLLPETPGVVINIGANVGMIALHLADRFQEIEVVAFEPNPAAFTLLEKNIVRNKMSDRIRTVACCIGDSNGVVRLSTVKNRAEYSSIGGIVHPAVAAESTIEIEVPVARLDDQGFDGKPVTCLVIDTEGAEGLVLRGAVKVLREHRPFIFFECEDRLMEKFGDSAESVCTMLESEGYEVRNALFPDRRVSYPFTGEIWAFPVSRED